MPNTTRRTFGKSLAAAPVAALPTIASAQSPVVASRSFPAGFKWGCATAAYQIEGAANEDGRGPSVWDNFSHTPGKTFQGETGDVADDSYHLYKEDVRLMKNLGAKIYRMSISWSRVFPDGIGKPNGKGLDYYKRVIDELRGNDIDPYVTLFHWDLPASLPHGWQSRDTAKAFGDYAAFIGRELSDRVHHFMTTNEFVCFTDLSYKIGQFAPGLKLGDSQVNQVRHHGILAHGLGVQALRANAKAGTLVGLAENATVFVPVIEEKQHVEAALRATRLGNAPFLTAVLEGKYMDAYLEQEGANAPKVEPGDMNIIGSPLDFVGLNVYTPQYVRAADTAAGFSVVPHQASFPHMPSPWLFVGPEVLYWAVRNVSTVWSPKEIYITENGCSADDVVRADGRIDDTDRVMYLRNHLMHLQRATAEGFPVTGYFLWSLLDNYEWADGYSKRFGIHYVDFKTEKRTPKLSAEWYKATIASNSVA